MTIKDFMTHQHRACDELLALAENAMDKKDFEDAGEKYQNFNYILSFNFFHKKFEQKVQAKKLNS